VDDAGCLGFNCRHLPWGETNEQIDLCSRDGERFPQTSIYDFTVVLKRALDYVDICPYCGAPKDGEFRWRDRRKCDEC